MNTIQKDITALPQWQQKYYKQLESFFTDNCITLSENQQHYLLWLAGIDNYTVEAFLSMFKTIRDHC